MELILLPVASASIEIPLYAKPAACTIGIGTLVKASPMACWVSNPVGFLPLDSWVGTKPFATSRADPARFIPPCQPLDPSAEFIFLIFWPNLVKEESVAFLALKSAFHSVL